VKKIGRGRVICNVKYGKNHGRAEHRKERGDD